MDQLLDILCGHSVTSLKLLAIEGVCVGGGCGCVGVWVWVCGCVGVGGWVGGVCVCMCKSDMCITYCLCLLLHKLPQLYRHWWSSL